MFCIRPARFLLSGPKQTSATADSIRTRSTSPPGCVDQTIVPNLRIRISRKTHFIRFVDSENNRLTFLTNNFSLGCSHTITELYKSRLENRTLFQMDQTAFAHQGVFSGTSENAVKIQVWIAISIYVLVAIIKKELKLNQSLYTILQILSVTIFDKTPILQALTATEMKNSDTNNDNRLGDL